ncbi:hypothetical protein ACQPZP_42605 [Spirillospora sp. CA-142024]|uniref:hypothetical protein n=1 Tax=Spirillospora sp. CA-142024 TaxID=3240036 RepID=UPI003D8A6C77
MNRSAKSLLSLSVLAPVVAALAVAAAPANAVPGPSTTLLYDTTAAAAPVTRTLPARVTNTAGRTIETGTGVVDGVIRKVPASSAGRGLPAASKLRAERAGCKLNPDTRLPTVGKAPLGGLPKGDCLGVTRRLDSDPGTVLPVPPGKAGGALLGHAGKVGKVVRGGKVGELTGARPGLPGARRAEMPVSMALPGPTGGLPNVPSPLGGGPLGLPVGSLVPATGRYAAPEPSRDLLGQANVTVNKVGAGLGKTGDGVGSVVDVLKAKNRLARSADGPLSMPGAPGLGLPTLPGIG